MSLRKRAVERFEWLVVFDSEEFRQPSPRSISLEDAGTRSYAWRPSERFQTNIGLPFSLNYRPTDAISFDLSYLPLTNASATVRWTLAEFWSVYGGCQTHSQGYESANRPTALPLRSDSSTSING